MVLVDVLPRLHYIGPPPQIIHTLPINSSLAVRGASQLRYLVQGDQAPWARAIPYMPDTYYLHPEP